MSESTTEYEKLVKALEDISIRERDGQIQTVILDDCLPSSCDVALTSCGEEQMSQLLVRLLNMARKCMDGVKDETIPLLDHAARALVTYALDKLCHDGYSLFHVIGAIALEHSRSSPALIVEAWKAACIMNDLSSKIIDHINMDAEFGALGQGFGHCTVRGSDKPYLQILLKRPLNKIHHLRLMTDGLEEALCSTYDQFVNALDAESGLLEAPPAAVLALHALRHLWRLGYNEELAIHAIANTDYHGLLGDTGQSQEPDWWAALIEYPEDTHKSVKHAWNTAQLAETMKDLEMSM
ncbi:uncharacterized protein AB675_10304 [Cyphellophora attinorum]|uniref:Uncharacterized protein n=1 Tax=Cyphellophora attinorum TaxID=1664694 RepID=A0A0N1H592_9EURO|nr:uncharacterized protein AB675_10304 [Phialophora attinorum]KPI37482.1 hypothetical protein AB675_10304 [Phialophora attinorum]